MILGIVFVGTLYPLFVEALTGEKLSVGPPYFNAVAGPLALILARDPDDRAAAALAARRQAAVAAARARDRRRGGRAGREPDPRAGDEPARRGSAC